MPKYTCMFIPITFNYSFLFAISGGMYMPAQALNMQGVPSGNPMAVQQGMPGMVPQGMMVMQV